MKLKVRNFKWLAGRPVVIINEATARKLNVRADEKVLLNSKKIYAVVDTFQNLVKNDEIGLSEELSVLINKKTGQEVEVSAAPLSRAGAIISKKLAGQELNEEEIGELVLEIVENNLTESEIAYFISAEKLVGMSFNETIFLIKAMVKSGKKLDFGNRIVADKHCIGGLAGNRTTPIVISICASAGLLIPKTSSRAITSASGTADVVETISRVEFTSDEIKKLVDKVGACLVWGGSLGLAPSDDKIIHVERIINIDVRPQLLASIMAKKISVGSNHILIDIPYGKEVKIKTLKQAKDLGESFKKIARYFKLNLRTVFTNGEEPIGRGIGPVLEMQDVISVLKNEEDCNRDLKEKALYLATQLLDLCEIKDSRKRAEEILASGKAYIKFKEIINAQNGESKDSNDFDNRVNNLKLGTIQRDVLAEKTGNIFNIENKEINLIARILGCPETKSAGLYIHRPSGKVEKGERVLTLYSESKSKMQEALETIKKNNPIQIK